MRKTILLTKKKKKTRGKTTSATIPKSIDEADQPCVLPGHRSGPVSAKATLRLRLTRIGSLPLLGDRRHQLLRRNDWKLCCCYSPSTSLSFDLPAVRGVDTFSSIQLLQAGLCTTSIVASTRATQILLQGFLVQ